MNGSRINRVLLYLCCPNSPDQRKRVEEMFRTRWNAVEAIDGKYITT